MGLQELHEGIHVRWRPIGGMQATPDKGHLTTQWSVKVTPDEEAVSGGNRGNDFVHRVPQFIALPVNIGPFRRACFLVKTEQRQGPSTEWMRRICWHKDLQQSAGYGLLMPNSR
jgi:hypothetical protein